MRQLLLAFLCILFAATAPAAAREQSDAPIVEVIGFSPDGRYFAYEQYGYDLASDALDAAIFVIDRETNKAVDGFPFGFIAADPANANKPDIDLETLRAEDGTPDLGKLRKLVREEATTRLTYLDIGTQGRRLAGIPLTQRAPASDDTAPISFVVAPTIPSAIPDQQLTYNIAAGFKDAPPDCVNAALPARDQIIAFTLSSGRSLLQAETLARKEHRVDWTMAPDTCPVGIWISDIIAPPDTGSGKTTLLVLFLTTAWSAAIDSAEYHATFIEMPEVE